MDRLGRARAMVRPWSLRVLPGAYFAGVTLLFAWPMLLGRSTSAVPGLQARLWPWRGVVDTSVPDALAVDGAASSYPWSVTFHEALRQFELPFWDWHSFTGGYDLASDGVAGAMYPVHWVLWLAFEPPMAHDMYVALHLWGGGVLMYVLLRHWRLPRGAALVGGTAWMLAPFNVGWLQAEMITPVLITTPLLFWSVSAAIRTGSWQRIFGASAALALALVAGNIVVFLVLILVTGIYASATWLVALARRRSPRELGRRAVTLLCIAVGGFALSAYSLVPTLVNLRSLGRRPAELDDMLPADQASPGQLWGSLWNVPITDEPAMLLLLGWCGRVTLVLAVLGLLHRRHGPKALAVVLVVFFTLLPASPWLVHVGWYAVPPLRVVAEFGRLTFLASFGMAILAALGTAVLLGLVSRVFSRVPVLARNQWPRALVGPALATAVMVELLPFAVAVNPEWSDTRATPFFPVTEMHEHLRRPDDAWPSLVLPLTPDLPEGSTATPFYSLWGSTAHIGGVDSVGGYDSAVAWRAASFTRAMEGRYFEAALENFSAASLPSFSLTWARLDLAQRAGVTHFYLPPGASLDASVYGGLRPELRKTYAGPDGQVWELVDPMRGPRLVGSAATVPTAKAAMLQFMAPDHDARASVVLERREGEKVRPPPPPPDKPVGEITDVERDYDSARVRLDAARRGWLVMPIGYAPGWHAELDGKAMVLRPADFAMTAVHVPPGAHTVTFTYRPQGFRAGLTLTIVALLVFAILLTRRRLALVPPRLSWRQRAD